MGKKSNSSKFTVTKEGLLPGLFFALFVRWCVAAYPYSGYKKPPMYGDFEAQRHWQEITVHTPVVAWYQNTSQNDLEYWGLDYPPLTAYHSFIMGLVAEWVDPESIRLFASRGYENESHKFFMRCTVFLSDIYFFVSAVLAICIDIERLRGKSTRNVYKRLDFSTILFLLYPGIILIDHGHFQYNCVSLGLFLWATFFITGIENDILATICFVFALNYKQMELYHALPFFFYLLRKCFVGAPFRGRIPYVIHRFNKLAISVISSFVIIWYPFMGSWNNVLQVIDRLFPLKRGVFEDKVSNVWCFVNVFVKLKSVYSHQGMAQICLITTALAALPSCLDLLFRGSKQKFVLSLINVSLAFFLFSFQVHEKSILLVAIPVALYFSDDPFMCFWFLLVSNFSMLPLLLRDGLLIPFIVTNLIYLLFHNICIKLAFPYSGLLSFFNANRVQSIVSYEKAENTVLLNLVSINFFLSFMTMIWLTVALVFFEPPPNYPDLYPLLISVFSCSHFVLFFIYFNYQQISLPMCLTVSQKSKTK